MGKYIFNEYTPHLDYKMLCEQAVQKYVFVWRYIICSAL